MTDDTQPEAREFTMSQYASKDDMIGAMHTRIAELESELEAVGAGGVQALSAAPGVTSEQRRLIGVIADKIEDGTLFQSGIYPKKDLARFVRNMLDTTPTAPAASPTPPAEQAAPKAAPEGPSDAEIDDFLDSPAGITWVIAANRERYRRFVRAALAKWAAPQQEPGEIPESIERMATGRYKVVPSHESMFHRWAVVAGSGTQQLYLGREVECQNMARKFAGAFLDGAFVAMQRTAPQPAPAPLSEREAFERDWEKRHAPAPINGRTRDDGRYGDSSIQDAWESWQARAAIAAQGGKV